MRVVPTAIPEVLILEPEVFADERGLVFSAFQAEEFGRMGLPDRWVQDNLSRSRRGTLRGLHYQLRPQVKLVRAVAGEVFDVAVDLRRSSPTFKRWVGARLSADDRRAMLVPAGFGHAFTVLSESADVLYKLTEPWSPELERVVRWDDPEIGIEWPLGGAAPILSAKDRDAPALADAELP